MVNLNWAASSSPNIKTVNLYYSIGNGSYSLLASMPAGTTGVSVVLGQVSGKTFNFYVTAVNSSGTQSPASNTVSVST